MSASFQVAIGIAERYRECICEGMTPVQAVDWIRRDWNEDCTLESEKLTEAEIEAALKEFHL